MSNSKHEYVRVNYLYDWRPPAYFLGARLADGSIDVLHGLPQTRAEIDRLLAEGGIDELMTSRKVIGPPIVTHREPPKAKPIPKEPGSLADDAREQLADDGKEQLRGK